MNRISTLFVKSGGLFSAEEKSKNLVRKELVGVRVAAMDGSYRT